MTLYARLCLPLGLPLVLLCAGGGAAGEPAVDACAPQARPLLGIVGDGRGGRLLARLDRRTLRPEPGRRVPVRSGRFTTGWDLSPDCRRIAIAERPARSIRIADVERRRSLGVLELPGGRLISALAWAGADRLVVLRGFTPSLSAAVVDLARRRVVARVGLDGHLVAVQPTDLGLVVLLAPPRRLGPARLVHVDGDGRARRFELDRVEAGFESPGRGRPWQLTRQLSPGLAVDELTGRAYVVAARGSLIAEVDLASGAIAYREPLATAPAGARRAAAAKGLGRFSHREARWLGDGRLAVSGENSRSVRHWRRALRRGELPTRIEPYGLRVVDARDWTASVLHPDLRQFSATGGVLVGSDAIPISQTEVRPTGLVAYGVDGHRRFVRFRGDGRIGLRAADWPYAYVTVHRRHRRSSTHVVDLRDGRTVHVIPTLRVLPGLLVR